MNNEQFASKLWQLKRLAWIALAGVVLIAVGLLLGDVNHHLESILVSFGILFVIPAFVYLVLLTIWHWKGRYRGTHSDLWGALLLIEVSGWSKLIYMFRHILPDARKTGRYAIDPAKDEV